MTSSRSSLLGVALALGLVPGVAVAQAGAPPERPAGGGAPSVTLAPSRAEGVVGRRLRVGPFGLRNDTDRRYQVRVTPVLLTQRRDAGLGVRDDAASLTAARRLLEPQLRGFDFLPSASQSVLGLVRRPSRSGGLYGGLVFRAAPRATRRPPGAKPEPPQIENVLELTASIFLDPPPAERRVRFRSAGPIRAEPAGARRLRLLTPVLNDGNAYEPVGGRVRVRDEGGKAVLSEPLERIRVLPDATVDLPAAVTESLGPGVYMLEARIRAGPRTTTARGRMRLVRVNEVEARGARLASVPAPRAFRGEPVEVEAAFLNTGNVRYAPGAELEVRARTSGVRGPVVARSSLRPDASAAPGREGKVEGTVTLPPGGEGYELTVRLLEGARPLDSRSVSVTPAARPSLVTSVADVAAGSIVTILTAALVALLFAGVLLARYISRLKRSAAGGTRGRPGG